PALVRLVVPGAEAVEDHDVRRDGDRPGRAEGGGRVDAAGVFGDVGGVQAAGGVADVQGVDGDPVELEGAAAGRAARGDQAEDDHHAGEQQRDAAGDQRRPQEAALVLPVFALQQQLELVGGMDRRGGARHGDVVVGGVHA